MERSTEKNNKLNFNWKLILGVIIFIAVALIIAFALGRKSGKDDKESAVEKVSKVVEDVKDSVKEDTLLTETDVQTWLEPVAELVTEKYHYRTANLYENYKTIKGVKVPGTTDMFVYSFDGYINTGIDFSQVKINVDNDKKEITINLPEAKILSHSADESSLEFRDAKNSIFNKTDFGDYAEIMSNQKQKEEERLLSDESYWKEVNENTQKTFEDFLKMSGDTQDYKVTFITGDEKEDTDSDTEESTENEQESETEEE